VVIIQYVVICGWDALANVYGAQRDISRFVDKLCDSADPTMMLAYSKIRTLCLYEKTCDGITTYADCITDKIVADNNAPSRSFHTIIEDNPDINHIVIVAMCNDATTIDTLLRSSPIIRNKLAKHLYVCHYDNAYDPPFEVSGYRCKDEYPDANEGGIVVRYDNDNYYDSRAWYFDDGETVPRINHEELQYIDMMKNILARGHFRKTRNGNTYSLFGHNMTFDLYGGILPVLTTKKMFTRGIIEELLFFLRGDTMSKNLEKLGVNIWKWNTSREFLDNNGLSSYADGDMGPMYGYQWRSFNKPYGHVRDQNGGDSNNNNTQTPPSYCDQLKYVIDTLVKDRWSRRIVMTTYNPLQANECVLYPCHGLVIQFGIENDNELSCYMYQRSQDTFLGSPFNITSYALLVHIVCNVVNNELDKLCAPDVRLVAGKLHMGLGDIHIYESHVSAVREQITRVPFAFPTVIIKKNIDFAELSLNNLSAADFEIVGYKSHPPIKAEMVA